MGDVGSLALGGALGTVAILIKQELLLAIVGGVFVLEALSVIMQVGVVQADAASACSAWRRSTITSSCRLERAEGHHPLPDRRDPLRAVQPDDAEAAMTTARFPAVSRTFSVTGAVLVVGAARSGVAAAELLARRGARVTLTDRSRGHPGEPSGCAGPGVTLELGGHDAETVRVART